MVIFLPLLGSEHPQGEAVSLTLVSSFAARVAARRHSVKVNGLNVIKPLNEHHKISVLQNEILVEDGLCVLLPSVPFFVKLMSRCYFVWSAPECVLSAS